MICRVDLGLGPRLPFALGSLAMVAAGLAQGDADYRFDDNLLMGSGLAGGSLERFNRADQVDPGTYHVDVYLNGQFATRAEVEIPRQRRQRSGGALLQRRLPAPAPGYASRPEGRQGRPGHLPLAHRAPARLDLEPRHRPPAPGPLGAPGPARPQAARLRQPRGVGRRRHHGLRQLRHQPLPFELRRLQQRRRDDRTTPTSA